MATQIKIGDDLEMKFGSNTLIKGKVIGFSKIHGVDVVLFKDEFPLERWCFYNQIKKINGKPYLNQ